MLKGLVVLLLLLALALTLYSNVGHAQVTASMGNCLMAVGPSPEGAGFCDSLRVGTTPVRVVRTDRAGAKFTEWNLSDRGRPAWRRVGYFGVGA